MQNENIEKFDIAWKHFVTTVKGRLIVKQKEDRLNAGIANLIISDAASIWFSQRGSEGMWFLSYRNENPEKAQKISAILRGGLKVVSSQEDETDTKLIKHGVPIAGAIAAYLIAATLGAGAVVKGAVSGGTGAILYTAIKQRTENAIDKNQIIDEYITQLNIYGDEIKSIIIEG